MAKFKGDYASGLSTASGQFTTEPNELTQSNNHERMPVLISDPADYESGSTEDAFKLASYAAEQMRIVQFGTEREDLLQVG